MPHARFDRFETIDVRENRRTDFEVAWRELTYACRFDARPGADRLVVSLRSSRGKPLETPPVFHPEHSPSEMNGHVLAISDPSLFLESDLELGCFFGTRQDDAVIGVIRIAEKIAASFGLDRTRIVYWGASAAGIGAAMAAVKSGATAVVVNGHLDGVGMGGTYLADAVAKTFRIGTFDDITNEFPLRARVPAALRAAQALSMQPKILLVQNVLDRTFYDRQYVPFCKEFGVPLDGGWDSSRTIMALAYSDPAGHALEPPQVRAQVIAECLPQLLGQMPAGPKGPASVFDITLSEIGTHTFGVPAGVSFVRLISNPVVVQGDARKLGAAITKISIDGKPVSISGATLASGFYEVDPSGPVCWTDGVGVLPVRRGCVLEVQVVAIAASLPGQRSARN